jgi:GT2 family glycosyltransferase
MSAPAGKIAPADAAGIGRRGENLSIMIPTYNCASYLRQTLQSLREQGQSIAEAQIAIVDDASTLDDPASAAKELWPGRATFIRQKNNVGLVANFNHCLAIAQRPWVHILHGDDICLPGAYAEFDQALRETSRAIAVFGRSVFMEARGFWKGTTPILGDRERGLLEYRPLDWVASPVQCAGVLVNRDEILELGAFDAHFTHVADWNLWWRIARTGRAAYSNRCVGGYRMFEGNHSSTLRRSGTNLREGIDQIQRVAADIPGDVPPHAIWGPMIEQIKKQCQSFQNDPQAYAANAALLEMLPAKSAA